MPDPFGRDGKPAPKNGVMVRAHVRAAPSPRATRTPDGPFKNVVQKKPQPQVVAPGLALLAKEQVATVRQAAGKNPSVTPQQVAHTLLNTLGLNPKAILHNAAVVGSQTLPPNAGVRPQPASQISQAGIPLIGPGTLGHAGALGILPFKKLLGQAAVDVVKSAAKTEAPKVAAKVVAKATGGRTAAEAATHMKEARAFWKAKMPSPPLESTALKPGEVSAKTGGEVGGKVRAAFTTGDQTVAEARKATTALQSAERGKRFGAGAAAREQAGGGTPGQIASLRAQKGELPYTHHPGLAGETSPVVEAMIRHVESLPTLREGDRLTAIESLRNWWRNEKPPTEGEQVLLEHAFGKDIADAIAKDPTFRAKMAVINAKAKRLGQEAFLLPRAVKSAGDVSAMFRQNLLHAVSHPVEFAKLVPGSLKSAVSESHFQAGQDAILNDPNYPLHWAAKAPFTDIGQSGAEGVGKLGMREEQFASNLAEKMNLRNLPGMEGLGKLGTGPGDIVRASDRSYVGLLNPSRQVQANRIYQKAALAGEDLTNPETMKAIGSAVGALTGRGSLGPWLERHAVTLNALLFSPRFAASRFNLLGFGGKDISGIPGFIPGSYYANLYRASPTAAKEVATSMRNLAIVAASVLYAATKAGAVVSDDPTNADFGKIRVGNTRVDIMAGLQAPVRMMAQEILQKETSSQTGKVTKLGGPGFNALGRLDPAWKFASNKASPLPGLVLQEAGLTHQAQKLTPSSIVQNLFEPLGAQDVIQQYQGTHSIPAAALAILLGGTGFGIQNYKAKAPKPANTDPFGRGGTTGKTAPDPFSRGKVPAGAKSSDPFGR